MTDKIAHRLSRTLAAALLVVSIGRVSDAEEGLDELDKWFLDQAVPWLTGLPENYADAIAGGIAFESAVEEATGQIEGDYAPDNYAPLVSACADNGQCQACLNQASARLNQAFFTAENNHVLLRRTQKKYEMMVALADGAANLGQYAKYAWMLQKGSPRSGMNVAKAKFEEHYADAQKKNLQALNNALVEAGQCHAQFMGDKDWYNRYGMPFYTQLMIKYTTH